MPFSDAIIIASFRDSISYIMLSVRTKFGQLEDKNYMSSVILSTQDRDNLLKTAKKACELGREVLLHYFGRLQHIQEKFQAGLVSEADKESERVILEFLKSQAPEIDFLGEESAPDLSQVQSSSRHMRWIVDPLDGTTNYIHRFPIFAVSLGLQVQDEIEVAVVDAPMLNEVYWATKNGGAYLNNQKLSVSKTEKISDAFLTTGFISEIEENLVEQLQVFSHVVRKVRAVRRLGAAAYDLCLVARGVYDGYWEKGIKPWDAAAGILLVKEAGGIVQTYRGDNYTPFHNSIIAGNHAVVLGLQKEIVPHILTSTN